MKVKKIILVILLLVLCLGFIDELSQRFDIYQKVINKNLSNSSIDNSITLEWNYTWGGIENEVGRGIALDSLGNIYITGYYPTIEGLGPSLAIFLAKFNNLGQFQWNRTFNQQGDDIAYSITIDSGNNIYVGGTSEDNGDNDLIIIKYNNLGDYLGNITWDNGPNDVCVGIALDSAENIYATGYSFNMSNEFDSDLILIKFDNLGNVQYNYTWGRNREDFGSRIVLDSSNNIYLTGQYARSSGTDICLLKYNNLGVFQWNRTLDKNNFEYGTGIALDSSENVYVSGITLVGSPTNYDMVLIKYNNAGTMLWNRTWGKTGVEITTDIAINSEDTIYLAGFVNYSAAQLNDFCLVQFNANGEQQYNHTWGGPKHDQWRAITVDSSNNIFLAGLTGSFGAGDVDVELAKYSMSVDKTDGMEIHAYDLSLLVLCSMLIIGIIIKRKLKH
ncbi:MAG: SBBP repeat-containing protein [Promethearchaeota archaeon]